MVIPPTASDDGTVDAGICAENQHYRGRLAATVQRQSNNDEPDFTDVEVLTVYLP